MNESGQTNRVEAFSDGVFAIAITLLVLDLHVPTGLQAGEPLSAALLRQWPVYLGFLTSFATIGIMWINHHRMYKLIRCVDHTLLILNALLLLGICILPFPTSLVAAYIGQADEKTAVLIYTGLFVLIAICFNLLWRYASHDGRLIGDEVDARAVEAITRQYRIGPLFYLAAFLLAWFSPLAGMLFTLLLAIYFAIPNPLY